MNREDILRELELLPVWQLRTPVPVANTASVGVATAETETLASKQKQDVPAAYQFRLLVSNDAHWAFVLAAGQSDESEALLQNMLKAVSVSIKHDFASADANYFSQYIPKVIVVMGEAETQHLLNETQSLRALRGKTHMHENIPTIVTFSPSYLLMNLQDKAKAWEDLCLAKFTISSL